MQFSKSAVKFMTDYTEIFLRLQQIPRLGSNAINELLAQINVTDLLDYDQDAFRAMGWKPAQIQRWFQPEQKFIQPALEWATQPQNHILHFLHPDYPYLLKQTVDAPVVLYVQGDVSILSEPQIAMVGSRYCSNYGEYWAKYFAAELWAAGLIVTSGLALGIDGFSHQAVVDVQGKTIGVLGNGLQTIYPNKHRKLARQMLEYGGALVSEFAPNQPPIPANFPRRNRIISGLSLATLVVEATERSGSLITARLALEQNRDVFAIPGSLQNSFSQGCHKLIKQGAMLVENVKDILENLPTYSFISSHSSVSPNSLTPQSAVKNTALSAPKARPALVEPDHPALFEMINHELISVDELVVKSGLDVEELLTQLLDLELQGLVVCENGCYRRNW